MGGGELNKRRKEVKVQNREVRGKETEDESDKSVGEKDVRGFNEHNSLTERVPL